MSTDPIPTLAAVPALSLGHYPTPVEELCGLRAALGGGPRIFVKRDDAIAFGFGGNKVRKLELVAARALSESADTLITAGGVQSNHARVTAAVAARHGMNCLIVANGEPPETPSANALLDRLFGAEVQYVASRDERSTAMAAAAVRLTATGRRPHVIPVGASTPLGALGYVRAVAELVDQMPAPDVIVHASSSGGTQAGLVAGCRLYALRTRVIGVSPDDSAEALHRTVGALIDGIELTLRLAPGSLSAGPASEVDDAFVGDGYGIPTEASREAIDLLARRDAILLDPTYTAKAMAALVSYVRAGRFRDDQTVLFWHTGGQVNLFA
ncbi:MAG: D-cysteine desulfhydrase family protein [Vicinamibacterales bacterium]|jgi:D-cysteine desulfhydrase family pyridoxal phosphate-dependent enzyme|nr:hypothetical protein [Acidobacteriota bacterium]MDP6372603.1 D-cysteine desulfhydrase family protein [Vicinamibacterales bacterium]MDP6610555.1 D-cysteine desulfhydrase family protein [Vicinamibacterales bacterium]MDP7294438.1 D-cysteine desulfhydrase family protein [Vicinamibacterales bacterium]MDP7471153.1 D-cysteine desulfhydrase family protein [Vicinamibacterales bacterium]|tara:strand:+ start:1914 stop:2891 length:978 start_codon:yes stop_codon:yes gene_type:complete